MAYTVWYGESKQGAEYVTTMAGLTSLRPANRQIFASRGFPRNPMALQRILDLDEPGMVVTQGEPEKPILAVEFCTEAPRGHRTDRRRWATI